MRVFNTKGQKITNISTLIVGMLVFLGKFNTEQQYALGNYDFLSFGIKAIMAMFCIWFVGTLFCSYQTLSLKK